MLAVVAGIVALLTIHEFLKLTESYGVQPLRLLTYIFTGIFFVLLAFNVGNDKPLLSTAVFVYCLGFAAAIAPFIFLTRAMRNEDLSTRISGRGSFGVCVHLHCPADGHAGAACGSSGRERFIFCICCWSFGPETSSRISWASRSAVT